MIGDPYKILGVSRDANDDEIKKAYRKLSRIYHPDANVNNPNAKEAEAKFKEVQEAYEWIMKERQGGFSSSSSWGSAYSGQGYGSSYGRQYYGGYNGQYTGDSNEMRAVYNYINAG